MIPFIIWGFILIGGALIVSRAFLKAERGNTKRPMMDACAIPADPTGAMAVEIEKGRHKCFGSGGMGLG